MVMLLTLCKWTPLKKAEGWFESDGSLSILFHVICCRLQSFCLSWASCCCTTTHLWGDQDGFESQNYSLCFGSSRRRVFGNDGGKRTRVVALEARAPEILLDIAGLVKIEKIMLQKNDYFGMENHNKKIRYL